MNEKELLEKRKKSIKDFIYSEQYTPMKFKEMSCFLEVPREDRKQLKEVLLALLEEGSVEITSRGKYIRPQNRNLIGIFTSHPRGFGFVRAEGQQEDIFIPPEYVNGAFYRDKVLVKIRGSEIHSKKRPEGMIIKILERGCKSISGTFEKRSSFGFVHPDDTGCGSDIFISSRDSGRAADRDKVVVRILSYGSEKKKPEGKVIKVLGSIDDPSTDTASVIYSYGIEESFSPAAYREAAGIPGKVSPEDCRGRKDLREKLTVTIDGEDARDLDDAITLEREGEGYLLGVHIADVSHYVKENSPLDQSALSRGTSIYLAGGVIPMLPAALSNGICSLNQGEDRLALSCIMHLDGRGNVIDHQIVETVIRVDERLSYHGVQTILDGEKHPEGLREEIRSLCFLMEEAAGLLKEKRKARGAIDFDFPESKIILDEEGYVSEIYPYERNTATDIIEDFMLLANETVAQDYFWQEIPFIYRIHEAPDPEKLKKLDLFIRNFGYYLRTEREVFHPGEIQKLLFSLEGEPEEALISRLTLRSMQRAAYKTLNAGHFGLSTNYYTHFTSPIRRYPDLQIHRIIKENLRGQLNDKRIAHYDKILPGVAELCSRLERRAKDAERDVEKLKKIEYMQDRIGEHFTGVISGVSAAGFYVELENTVEGLVPVQSLLDDHYHFDQDQYRLTGQKSGRVFTLGQRVEVVADVADKLRRMIDFSLEEFSPDELSYDEKSGIAVNDWMTDEEADRLLKLYSRT